MTIVQVKIPAEGIARKFGVSKQIIYAIKYNRSWKEVTI